MINTKCFICEGDDHEPFLSARDTLGITEKEFSLTKCRKCGLIFLNPAPDPQEMGVYYPDGYWARRGSRLEGIYRDVIINLELRMLRRFTGKGGRLLDVGCGSGEFLFHAEKLGFESYGVETSDEIVKYSKKTFGLKNIINSDLLSTSFPEGFFDVILLNHVLEHLYNPIENLIEAKRILKNEGVLIIQVPNIESYQFRVFREKWHGLSLPQHLYHFNPQTIRLSLEKVGLKVFKTLHHSIRNSPAFITISLTGLNIYKLTLRKKEGKLTSLQKLLILFLNGVFLPIALLEGWFKKGGVITVFARKTTHD